MKLVLPLPPNMANGRLHWRAKHRKRVTYMEACDNRQLMRLVPRPVVTFERATIRATLYVWAMMDYDNAMARLKWPVDWLVTRGYLGGDDPHSLKWADMPSQEIDRKHQRIELEITPA